MRYLPYPSDTPSGVNAISHANASIPCGLRFGCLPHHGSATHFLAKSRQQLEVRAVSTGRVLPCLSLNTLSEGLRLLRNQPVASINIRNPEQREKLPNRRQNVVRHICALCPADEQGGFLEASLARVFVREVAQVA